jgi:hypothetical protein
MKRKDEEFCKAEFHNFVTKVLDPTSVRWEEVQDADEPPDFFLSLGTQKFAVEVTNIMEIIDVSPRPLSSCGISAALSSFTDEVEKRARDEGILHGTYVIGLEPLDDFGKVKPSLIAAILDYVRATKTLATAPMEIVLRQGNSRCDVEKAGDQEDCIAEVISAGGGWEGDLKKGLRQLIEDALNKKQYKLRNIDHPKILLFLDAYRYLLIRSWRGCASAIPSLCAFHTVFVAVPDGRSLVLYSQDPDWMKLI